MTTEDLKSMTVERLQQIIGNAILCCEHDYTAWTAQEAVDELARRLEEAQEKIVAQQARIKKWTQVDFCPDCDNTGAYYVRTESGEGEPVQCRWCYDNPRSLFNLSGVEDDLSALAAHDAELTAKAKAEALEERAEYFENGDYLPICNGINHISSMGVGSKLRAKAAEYRAKAGRKE